MTEPQIIRSQDCEPHPLHGEGKIKRIIYPTTVGSKKLFVGIAEVGMGEAPHVFHRHGTEIVGTTRLDYAEDFEEFYYVVSGSGTMQWILPDGSLREAAVSAGDAVYMPPGVVEHRVLNTGSSLLQVLYGGSPPARFTPLAP